MNEVSRAGRRARLTSYTFTGKDCMFVHVCIIKRRVYGDLGFKE